MLQSRIINSWTDVSLKSRFLVDATSSTSCMRQLVLVDVSMSDFISRWGYVVQMSMNCLYVSVFIISWSTVLSHNKSFKMKKNVYTPVKKNKQVHQRTHDKSRDSKQWRSGYFYADLNECSLSIDSVQEFTLSWFNIKMPNSRSGQCI